MHDPDEVERITVIVARDIIQTAIANGSGNVTPDEVDRTFRKEFPSLYEQHSNWLLFGEVDRVLKEVQGA